jgi:hypothetical protein
MNDHQLGAALRAQVLHDLQHGRSADGRRLQAVAGDLCGGEQGILLPALRHLVMSAAFASAASQSPPLADPRLRSRLMQELRQVFTPAICQRMEAVLQGLLNLPPQDATVPPPPAPRPLVAPEPTAPRTAKHDPATPATARRSGGTNVLVAVLAFLTGGLLMGLVGALVLLQQSPRRVMVSPPANRPSPPPVTDTAPSTPPQQPSLPEPAPSPAPEPPAARPDLAVASIQGLYEALSSKTYDRARQFFGGAAADQFDPSFFDQFARVSVSDLRETGQAGSIVTLEGQVTFTYPDGTSQSESRTFTVDTATDPALITASSFGAVIKAR